MSCKFVHEQYSSDNNADSVFFLVQDDGETETLTAFYARARYWLRSNLPEEDYYASYIPIENKFDIPERTTILVQFRHSHDAIMFKLFM